ncbi:hypothetical protein [Sulfitobacter donghicola]|uniref:Cobyric acid synthase n=1 Tax=Sulfitobacter donghicola DSW-25 = KCTC 12864 = JCM 14565 TaxID=1300350 RepID=A0A073IUY2_9RHOB|nr:hypothetical protein [Sulfitobacter donghicola]KEJ89197.1 cobyric acid synthase [Sulfitobacter donghicola DSW-25 = KCTC 12864 = JCM 14565]KIN68987.1 hypothetical protein Z948_2720 [Sulfitobacter donghicola DSW-25 = KCTC 12864 = JCM 14565]
MNTPAHLLIGAAVMGKKNQPRLIWAAMAGALMPDFSLYLLAGVSLFILGIDPHVVFNQLYFSDAWQTVFAMDNSFILWGAGLAAALWWGKPLLVAFAGAGLIHLCLDFPLHHDDGRSHFWPISWWVFESPLSYWDIGHGASWVAPLEGALAAVAAIRLWLMDAGQRVKSALVVLLMGELWITWSWLFNFGQ